MRIPASNAAVGFALFGSGVLLRVGAQTYLAYQELKSPWTGVGPRTQKHGVYMQGPFRELVSFSVFFEQK